MILILDRHWLITVCGNLSGKLSDEGFDVPEATGVISVTLVFVSLVSSDITDNGNVLVVVVVIFAIFAVIVSTVGEVNVSLKFLSLFALDDCFDVAMVSFDLVTVFMPTSDHTAEAFALETRTSFISSLLSIEEEELEADGILISIFFSTSESVVDFMNDFNVVKGFKVIFAVVVVKISFSFTLWLLKVFVVVVVDKD
uniref:Uncharacterized protein n=1 Tax=Glossina austeni TaxID=7395 RepID=A0A1A9VPM5_GLOAU